MIYRYSVDIPLEYNKFSPYSIKHNTEFCIKINPELKWNIDIVFKIIEENSVVKEF